MYTRLLAVAVSCSLFGLAGCFTSKTAEPKFIEEIRPIPPITKSTSYSIQRKDFLDALTKSQENTIRLVPVFSSVSTATTYEYRVFDIRPLSAYSLLGLENSDVLIAVNRYLLKRPEQFATFVQLLAREDEATIEIRRGGEAKLFKYSFLPSLKESRS
jgi:type II secretory pathway component PulC